MRSDLVFTIEGRINYMSANFTCHGALFVKERRNIINMDDIFVPT